MRKRILSALLCLCMVVCMLPAVSFAVNTASGTCGQNGSNVTWTLDSSGTLTIRGTGEMLQDFYFFDASVKNQWSQSVRSVVVEQGVTSIGASAFSNCTNLTQATIADSVQEIGAYAFRNCTALKSIAMPKTLKLHGLGTSAFWGCSNLESISVPAGINSILNQTFYGCSSLTNVTLPDDLSSIDGWAFMNCTSLKQLALPMSATHFGEFAFGFEQDAAGNQKKIDGFKISTHTKSAEEYCENNGIAYEIAHKWKTIPGKAATCTETGLTEGIQCEVGGEIQTEQTEIPKLPHKYTNYVYNNDAQIGVDGTETATCDYGCGNKNTRTKAGTALTVPDEPEVLPTVTFYDIEPGSYYESAVWWAVNKEITNGTSNTTFSPNNTCTRAQVVTFLWRAKGKPEPTSNYNPFYDVSSDAYYYKAVLWAVEQGITNGTSASMFSPNAGCTRGQVVTFLWRAEGEPYSGASNVFADVNTSEYYGTAVLWAVEHEITNGTGANTFSPNMTCTRGQIVTFLYRFMR